VQVLLAMVVGIALGLSIGSPAVGAVGWMGTVFVQALRMVIVPLVFFSLTSGVASIGTGRELGRLGAKTLAYYVVSSFLAILVGFVLVTLIRPGVGADISGVQGKTLPDIATPSGLGELLLGLLLDFIPTNPVAALAGADMLGIIGFSVALGVTVAHLPEAPRSNVRNVLGVGFEIMMILTGFVIRFLPLGVLGLVATAAGESGLSTFVALGKYMLTIALGLVIHLFIVLPLLLMLLGRIDPRIHFKNMMDPLLTAFSTSSSGATLPVTLRAVENKVGVSNRVTSFVVPMGATINMDGTALYECAGVIFIAQVLGAPLDAATQLTIVVTAFAASVGAAAIPSAGLVMIFIILEATGLASPEATIIVGTMLAIDRPLDMMRTAVNVFSDSCGAAIVARSEGETTVDVA
jgi:Na+/H+-dicarboxylate symporter